MEGDERDTAGPQSVSGSRSGGDARGFAADDPHLDRRWSTPSAAARCKDGSDSGCGAGTSSEGLRLTSSVLEEIPQARYNCGTMSKPDLKTSIQLPREFLRRADALVKKLSSEPVYAALGGLNRSKVLRLAIARGLEALEAEAARQRKGGRA